MYVEDGKRDARWKTVEEIKEENDEFPQIVKTEPLSPPPYNYQSDSHRRHDSPDISPPRRAQRRHDSLDISPPRRAHRRHDSPDISPPRRAQRRHDSPDISPPRRAHRRHDSPDISPPRRAQRRHDSPDISPPRRGRKRHDSPDVSPPRKSHKRNDSPDISPPRRGQTRHDSPDISPPRRHKPNQQIVTNRPDPTPNPLPPPTNSNKNQTLSGIKPGLQSAHGLKEEIAAAKIAKEKYYRNLDTNLSGRNAETVYRNKEGKRIDPKMEKVLSKEDQRKKMEEDEKFAQWGRG